MARLLSYKNIPKPQSTLLWGGPKTGKTDLIGTLTADGWKLLYLDAENGVDTLMKLPDKQLDDIEYIKIPDTPQNPCADETLLHMFEAKTAGYICHDHGKWKCGRCASKKADFFTIDMDELTPENGWIIAIESGSQFAESAFNNICNRNNISLADGDAASFTIWGCQGAHINKLFGMIQNGKWSVVVTAHEVEVANPDKTKKLTASIGTRKVAANFGKYFNHIVRTYKQGSTHKIASMTNQAPNCETGSRTDIDLAVAGSRFSQCFAPASALQGAGVKATVAPKLGAKPVNPALAALKAKSAAPVK